MSTVIDEKEKTRARGGLFKKTGKQPQAAVDTASAAARGAKRLNINVLPALSGTGKGTSSALRFKPVMTDTRARVCGFPSMPNSS